MAHDPRIAIRDNLREIEFLGTLTARLALANFRTDPVAFRAAAFSVQSISEAVRHIPDYWLADFPHEPWSAIKATGNKIRHEYFRIDEVILWEIMTRDVSAMEIVMKRMLSMHSGDAPNSG